MQIILAAKVCKERSLPNLKAGATNLRRISVAGKFPSVAAAIVRDYYNRT